MKGKVDVIIDGGPCDVGLESTVIDLSGTEYKGYVSHIQRLATTDSEDKSRIEVWVHMDGADENVILGVEGDVTIYTDGNDHTLNIPYSAYYSDSDGDYCYVIEKGRIEKKYFECGIVGRDNVEVLSGLSEGDVVITDSVTDEKIGTKAKGI